MTYENTGERATTKLAQGLIVESMKARLDDRTYDLMPINDYHKAAVEVMFDTVAQFLVATHKIE